jgi:hypothetical protein
VSLEPLSLSLYVSVTQYLRASSDREREMFKKGVTPCILHERRLCNVLCTVCYFCEAIPVSSASKIHSHPFLSYDTSGLFYTELRHIAPNQNERFELSLRNNKNQLIFSPSCSQVKRESWGTTKYMELYIVADHALVRIP